MTDAVGLGMIFPVTRKLALPSLQHYVMGRLNIQPMEAGGDGFHAGPVGAGPGMTQSVEPEEPAEPQPTAEAISAAEDWDHPVID